MSKQVHLQDPQLLSTNLCYHQQHLPLEVVGKIHTHRATLNQVSDPGTPATKVNTGIGHPAGNSPEFYKCNSNGGTADFPQKLCWMEDNGMASLKNGTKTTVQPEHCSVKTPVTKEMTPSHTNTSHSTRNAQESSGKKTWYQSETQIYKETRRRQVMVKRRVHEAVVLPCHSLRELTTRPQACGLGLGCRSPVGGPGPCGGQPHAHSGAAVTEAQVPRERVPSGQT